MTQRYIINGLGIPEQALQSTHQIPRRKPVDIYACPPFDHHVPSMQLKLKFTEATFMLAFSKKLLFVFSKDEAVLSHSLCFIYFFY